MVVKLPCARQPDTGHRLRAVFDSRRDRDGWLFYYVMGDRDCGVPIQYYVSYSTWLGNSTEPFWTVGECGMKQFSPK